MAHRSEVARAVVNGGARLLVAGPVAGIAGGVVMALSLVLSAVATGAEPLAALEPMGAAFAGPDAPDGGGGRLALGLLLHLALSALLGLLFLSVLARDFPAGGAAITCVGFSFVALAFMTSLVVPAVNPVLADRFHDLGGSWVTAHALFGATVGYFGQRLRHGLPVRTARPLQARTT